jgi:hypothetical protein
MDHYLSASTWLISLRSPFQELNCSKVQPDAHTTASVLSTHFDNVKHKEYDCKLQSRCNDCEKFSTLDTRCDFRIRLCPALRDEHRCRVVERGVVLKLHELLPDLLLGDPDEFIERWCFLGCFSAGFLGHPLSIGVEGVAGTKMIVRAKECTKSTGFGKFDAIGFYGRLIFRRGRSSRYVEKRRVGHQHACRKDRAGVL